MNEFWGFMHGYFRSNKWLRIRSKLDEYKEEVKDDIGESNDEYPRIISRLNKADAALENNDINAAWECFHSAKRRALLTIKDSDQLKSKTNEIIAESEKLNAWRRGLINTMLFHNENVTGRVLYDAAKIRDEHYDNLAFIANVKKSYHTLLGFLFILVFMMFAFMLNAGMLDFGEASVSYDNAHTVIPAVLLFGLFGSVFSAILKSLTLDKNNKIPEIVLAHRITFMRIMLGVGSALIIYIMILSRANELLGIGIIAFNGGYSEKLIYVISFIAGFSERLVLGAVNSIDKKV